MGVDCLLDFVLRIPVPEYGADPAPSMLLMCYSSRFHGNNHDLHSNTQSLA